MMTNDLIQTKRYKAPGVCKIADEILGPGATKNQYRLLVPESVFTVTEYGSDYGLRHSVIEFTKAAHLITRAGEGNDGHGNLKLATFPKGRIWVHGAVGTLTSVDVSDSANISDTGTGDYSFGTDATANCTLDGTNVDLGPSAALIDPFVSGVGSAHASSVLAAGALFDGSATATPVFLNIIFDAGDVTTGNGTADLVGKLIIKWSYLGDF
jgi:hypothetical protein